MDRYVTVFNQVEYNSYHIAEKIRPFINIEGCKRIFIKPNMVINPWKGEENNWIATVTNRSLIEAVLMVIKEKATEPIEITIGDAPMARSKHEITLKLLKLRKLIEEYNVGFLTITLIDIRDWYWKYVSTMCVSRKHLKGDPKGVRYLNLSSDSAFFGKQNNDFEAFDDIQPVSEFHNEKDNIFGISASILEADLFINLPKLKTHRIAGLTCAMKNLVGMNANKNCVPHNTRGVGNEGGDAFKDVGNDLDKEFAGFGGKIRRLLRRKKPILNYCLIPVKVIYDKLHRQKEQIGYGMWHGNDTIWRSIIDLNRIILYSNKDGQMTDTIQRRYLCITDAIVSGEGEGPLHPTPKNTNLLLVSDSAVAIDLFASKIMGFDWKKIPSIEKSMQRDVRWPLVNFDYTDVIINYKENRYDLDGIRELISFNFIPTKGWEGYIEQ